MITVSNDNELKAVRYALATAAVARSKAAWDIRCKLFFSSDTQRDEREMEHLLRQAAELDSLRDTVAVA